MADTMCNVVTATLKGNSEWTSEQLSLPKRCHYFMTLMNDCLTFLGGHKKEKNRVQQCWMTGCPEMRKS